MPRDSKLHKLRPGVDGVRRSVSAPSVRASGGLAYTYTEKLSSRPRAFFSAFRADVALHATHGALVDIAAASLTRRPSCGEGGWLPEPEDRAEEGVRGEEDPERTASIAALRSASMPAPVTALTSK